MELPQQQPTATPGWREPEDILGLMADLRQLGSRPPRRDALDQYLGRLARAESAPPVAPEPSAENAPPAASGPSAAAAPPAEVPEAPSPPQAPAEPRKGEGRHLHPLGPAEESGADGAPPEPPGADLGNDLLSILRAVRAGVPRAAQGGAGRPPAVAGGRGASGAPEGPPSAPDSAAPEWEGGGEESSAFTSPLFGGGARPSGPIQVDLNRDAAVAELEDPELTRHMAAARVRLAELEALRARQPEVKAMREAESRARRALSAHATGMRDLRVRLDGACGELAAFAARSSGQPGSQLGRLVADFDQAAEDLRALEIGWSGARLGSEAVFDGLWRLVA